MKNGLSRGFSIVYLLAAFLLMNCSSEDPIDKEPEIDGSSKEVVAKDDSYSTGENEVLVIDNLIENDTYGDYGRITDFDANTSKGGSVKKNEDGSLTYTPPSDFIGEDSFNYTLCDAEIPPNCSNGSVLIKVSDAGDPVAVNDSYQTPENESYTISNYLTNDDVKDNAQVTEVSGDTGNAKVTLEEDGSISYVPNTGFSGEDTFTYTICDDDETPNCSTATITMNVVDEGSPKAEADAVVLSSGTTEVTLDNLLNNDDLTDDAVLTSVDDAENGTVKLNEDGTVTFTPQAGFVGDATFIYTICDDDPEATCSTATVTVTIVEAISFNIPSDLQDYYSDVAIPTVGGTVAYEVLSTFTNEMHTTHLVYQDRHDYLYDADADPNDPSRVILMYSGESRPDDEYQLHEPPAAGETYNTEHIYPQSKLDHDEAANDLHHMRVADINVNSERLNYPYTDGSGNYHLVDGNKWYPGDDWKGDVARMVFYVNIRYGEKIDKVGNLDLFLEWNREDPVSIFEMQRNNVIEGAQGNRNPFIDNPYLATLIWGGQPAENRWE